MWCWFVSSSSSCIQAFYLTLHAADPTKVEYADVLSVLAMTMAHGKGESLSFKLQGNPTALDEWGHE